MLAAAPLLKRAAVGLTLGAVGTGLWWSRTTPDVVDTRLMRRDLEVEMPQRDQILESLQSDKEFDVLVIGGGATGTGIALVRTRKPQKEPSFWILLFPSDFEFTFWVFQPSHVF